jgi:hypothetical protein
MIMIVCDSHTRYQQIAMMDTETVAGQFLGTGVGGIFTVAKLGYDAASFGAAYVFGCK